MASATLTLDQWLFPDGTTVYATPQNFNDEPVIAVVASNAVSLDGLHEDTPYLLRARVAGSLNEVRFRSSLDTAGGGGGSVVVTNDDDATIAAATYPAGTVVFQTAAGAAVAIWAVAS